MSLLLLAAARSRANRAGLTDPDFANVVSLLPFDGTNGSTSFPDVIGRTWTTSVSPTISTSQSKWGGASGSFTSSAFLDNTDAATWKKLHDGTSFTVDVYVRQTGLGGTQFIMGDGRGSSASIGFALWLAGTLPKCLVGNGSGTPICNYTFTASVLANTWHLISVVFNSATSTYSFYVDNVLDGTASPSGSFSSSNSTDQMRIGRASGGASAFPLTGFIDDLRVTIGIARDPTTYANAAWPTS